MMSLWDALRMNMMISYQELVRTFHRVVYDTPFSFAFMVILTSVFFGFVMNLDFGRYQLSLLTSAINSFRAEKLGG
ncbi:hypothetical protein B8014_19525 [Klebsiella pneumoniae]|nr:hypothetical protein B8Z95_24210 [Klebsiella pneumoniae]OVF65035.1 hypothetical protein B5L86_21760 [Klebsiella pneumoniae]OVH14305.1 hypothetical protein B8004_13855 [Klebsiella pneumoniae]OVH78761.1 hypothetical protein B8015_18785 [Klebsiella pneumoniae]OVH79526.1 hypothetical protein B8014_19525 [Klebsiella pneumoniae]